MMDVADLRREYTRGGLHRADLPAEPLALFEKWLAQACEARLTIHEGKYHQVKRMFAAIGNKVIGLHRERIGALGLDDELAPGEYRELTAEEVAQF